MYDSRSIVCRAQQHAAGPLIIVGSNSFVDCLKVVVATFFLIFSYLYIYSYICAVHVCISTHQSFSLWARETATGPRDLRGMTCGKEWCAGTLGLGRQWTWKKHFTMVCRKSTQHTKYVVKVMRLTDPAVRG